jgi:hypothetical protein
MSTQTTLTAALAVIAALALVACGGGGSEDPAEADQVMCGEHSKTLGVTLDPQPCDEIAAIAKATGEQS